jgi:hypothetical protein
MPKWQIQSIRLPATIVRTFPAVWRVWPSRREPRRNLVILCKYLRFPFYCRGERAGAASGTWDQSRERIAKLAFFAVPSDCQTCLKSALPLKRWTAVPPCRYVNA